MEIEINKCTRMLFRKMFKNLVSKWKLKARMLSCPPSAQWHRFEFVI